MCTCQEHAGSENKHLLGQKIQKTFAPFSLVFVHCTPKMRMFAFLRFFAHFFRGLASAFPIWLMLHSFLQVGSNLSGRPQETPLAAVQRLGLCGSEEREQVVDLANCMLPPPHPTENCPTLNCSHAPVQVFT